MEDGRSCTQLDEYCARAPRVPRPDVDTIQTFFPLTIGMQTQTTAQLKWGFVSLHSHCKTCDETTINLQQHPTPCIQHHFSRAIILFLGFFHVG